MSRWRGIFIRTTHRAEQQFDRVKSRLSARYDPNDPLMVMAYRGYGTAQRIHLKGRVLEDPGLSTATPDDSRWRNLVNTYKRFESDEVPGATVRARFQNIEQQVVTDEEGYFDFYLSPTRPLPPDVLWHPIELELLSPTRPDHLPVKSLGIALVPPPTAKFGVISDMDDTILHTHATNLVQMGRNVFMGNVHTRITFPGVPQFYHALQNGADGNENNPIFYVSSSPWNLYDMLEGFLSLRNIPAGPLALRDWGITNEEVLPTKHAPHKFKAIRQILNTYPHLPFILIGDSGQEDAHIYHSIAEEYAGRVLALYIRDVSHHPRRAVAVRRVVDEISAKGYIIVLSKDTHDFSRHAAAQGWIMPAAE